MLKLRMRVRSNMRGGYPWDYELSSVAAMRVMRKRRRSGGQIREKQRRAAQNIIG